jgi:opacity protein-like surface antigen
MSGHGMQKRVGALVVGLLSCVAATAAAQPADESRFSIDVGFGFDVSVNGNINSGAIGRVDGQAAAILPNAYGDVYGTGLHLRFGAGYSLDDASELRGVFTFQSADADLVRLGDIGPSSLYAQYSDYQTLGLDFGYRRYIPLRDSRVRPYAEASLGIAFIDAIDVVLAAPQADVVFDNTDFFDQTAAFTWGIGAGVLFPVADRVDLNVQAGFRRVSGLAEVDQLIGTGLDDINNDSARFTFPVVVGARIRF